MTLLATRVVDQDVEATQLLPGRKAVALPGDIRSESFCQSLVNNAWRATSRVGGDERAIRDCSSKANS
ncbi:hypothetical protein [Paraburkholderia graminis]|uniref:Uncharacterized protein n=1 Tax=Paraburkholderia graminis (strain ATCC 700544 / DSM 17151 / LMG 18924 / NCIMB 13744 / C4D1M) TaxID=396598 RepID=B1G8A2_PARG4|nr:hypothetical protein [Paraburkholderia graminis]EDT07601.1 hypothetical protein BgramDRAFT_5570 [Paraburkholderia graminis C4D1M]